MSPVNQQIQSSSASRRILVILALLLFIVALVLVIVQSLTSKPKQSAITEPNELQQYVPERNTVYPEDESVGDAMPDYEEPELPVEIYQEPELPVNTYREPERPEVIEPPSA